MRDLVILLVHVLAALVRLMGPGGIRSVVAESVLVEQQVPIINRQKVPGALPAGAGNLKRQLVPPMRRPPRQRLRSNGHLGNDRVRRGPAHRGHE